MKPFNFAPIASGAAKVQPMSASDITRINRIRAANAAYPNILSNPPKNIGNLQLSQSSIVSFNMRSAINRGIFNYGPAITNTDSGNPPGIGLATAVVGGYNIFMYSIDGISWIDCSINSGNIIYTNYGISSIAFYGTKYIAIFEPNSQYILLSSDGKTWDIVNTPSQNVYPYTLLKLTNDCIILTSFGIYYSDSIDISGQWIASTYNGVGDLRDGYSIVKNDNYLLAAMNNRTNCAPIIISNDNGRSWSDVTSSKVFFDGCYTLVYGQNKWTVCGHKDSNAVMAYSDDGGESWTDIPENPFTIFRGYGQNCIAFNGNNRYVAIGRTVSSSNTTVIYYSNNGTSWTASNMTGITLYNGSVKWNGSRFIIVSPSNPNIIYSSDGINWSIPTSEQNPKFNEYIYTFATNDALNNII